MSPAKFSVKNSLFVNIVSVIIIILGLYSWFNMKQEAFPNINLDKVAISTVYAGATPQEIEKLITIPIEEELAGVDDIDEISSVSAENFSSILVEIDPDTKNKDKVVQDIQRAVDRVKDLPDDIDDDPLVTEIQTKNIPVIQVSLSGLPERELRDYADVLRDLLLDIPGVATVEKAGWNEREIRVKVAPKKVKDYYLSLNEIILALKNKNLNLPCGTIQDKDDEYLIRTIGEFNTKEEIEEVIIRANEEGNWIRIKDIAKVEDSFKDDELIFKTNGKKAINLVIVKRESADIIKIVKQVNRKIQSFSKNIPKDLKINTFDDMSYYVKRRLNVLVNNGLMGIFLVVLCLLLFLHPRIAFLTALGLPVAFSITLIIMNFMGISINLISMFGMIIVLGMLVDDGIIIAENSYRYIENGLAAEHAAIKGTDEVTKPVVATVLTTFAFFFPLFLMSGIMGKYVSHIPEVVIIMLMASLLEALFILPSHIADFAKAFDKNKRPLGEAFLLKLSKLYEKFLKKVIKYKYFMLLVIGGLILLAFITFQHSKFILFSSEGIEEFLINMEVKVSLPLEETDKIISKVENILSGLPKNEVENFVTTIGIQGNTKEMEGFAESGSNYANIFVYLTPESHRKRKSKEIIEEIREKTKEIKAIKKITFSEIKPGPPVGKAIAVRVKGDDYKQIKLLALRIEQFIQNINGIKDVEDDYKVGKNELRVIIDEKQATKLFLTVKDIAFAIRYGFEGGIATVIRTTDEEIDVIVKFPEEKQKDFSAFDSILIPNKYGKLIALNKVAHLKKVPGISSIKHLDRKRVVTVTANVDEDIITSRKLNKMVKNEFKNLGKEYLGLNISYGGENEDTKESMHSLAVSFIWGLLIVFLILASTFGSILQPSIIITSIPFGLISVVFVFFLHRQPLSFFAIMGSIGLAGVAVNDSIVLVEFINKLRDSGMEKTKSIIQGAKLRIRPVLLTTITTVCGLMPVAYGWGGSDPIIKPMALALSWGLIGATFSTLIIIPIIYSILDDLPPWVRIFLVPIIFWPLVLVGGKKYLFLHEKEKE